MPPPSVNYERAPLDGLGEIGHNYPVSALSTFVAQIRTVTGPVGPVRHMPDGTTSLMFRLAGDGSAGLYALGARTRALYKRASGSRTLFQVVFRPGGGYPFLGVPLGNLADRIVPLRDLWGARADVVLDQLAAAKTHAQRLAAIERALVERLRASRAIEPAALPTVRRALALLATPATTLGGVAQNLRVSERHLRRVFFAVVGLSPKRYARIVRFQRAVACASRGSPQWSQIAADSGYYDQAHLCAEFRELAETSPGGLLREDATLASHA